MKTDRTFNPYKDARGDARAIWNATSRLHKRMCWTCGLDKPIAGGKMPGVSGQSSLGKPGQQFRCGDCDAKREARKAAKAAAA